MALENCVIVFQNCWCSQWSGASPFPSVLWLLRAVVCVRCGWIQTSIRLCRREAAPGRNAFRIHYTAVGALSFSLSHSASRSLFIQRSPGVPALVMYVCDDMLSLTAARMKNNAPLCESQLIWWMGGYMHFAALAHSAPGGLMQMDPPAEIFMARIRQLHAGAVLVNAVKWVKYYYGLKMTISPKSCMEMWTTFYSGFNQLI